MARKRRSECEFFSDKLRLRLNLSLRADPGSVSKSVERIMQIVEDMRCAAGKEFEIEAALHESLVNAVVHGAKGNPKKRVKVCVLCDEERGTLIIVRDPGKGFEPASVPSPLVGENIFSSHGRGIYLINQLMDEVTFKKGGTEIHMRKRP